MAEAHVMAATSAAVEDAPRAKTLALPVVERTLHDGAHLRFASAKLRGLDVEAPASATPATDEAPPQRVDGVVIEEPYTAAIPLSASPPTSAPADFEASCTAIRTRLRESERYLVRELFAISDMIAVAEKLFDPATPVEMPPGTRSGKFAHAMAKQLGRTAPWVEKFQQLARVDQASRALAEEQADGSLRMLIDIAREPDVATRIRALNRRATQGAGRKTSMTKLLAAAGHPLRRVAETFLHEAATLANVPPATSLPPALVARFPELAPYGTVGEVRAALQSPVRALLPPRPARVNAPDPGSEPRGRTLCLPRDGTPVEGLRVVAVTDAEVVLEVDPPRPPEGPHTQPAPADTKPGPATPARLIRAKAPPAPQASLTEASPLLEALPDGASDVVGFTCDQAELAEAIRRIGLVTPGAVTVEGEAGYLFEVRGDGTCSIDSINGGTLMRVTIKVRDILGEGRFVYPAWRIAGLKPGRGQVAASIAIRSFRVADAHSVQHVTSSGASSTHATLAPRLLSSMDRMLSEATNARTYGAAILRHALLAAQPFAEKNARTTTSEPGAAVVHILGPEQPNRDGTMYAEGLNRFYFRCDDFVGKPAQIPAAHIRQLGAFLRAIGRSVVLRDARGTTFAASEDGSVVFGWRHKAIASPECRWVPLSWDRVALFVPHERVLQELAYIRRELPQRRDSARVIFDAVALTLRFEVGAEGSSRSSPISVQLAGPEAMPVAASFAHEVNVDSLIALFNDVRTTVVEFRTFPFEDHNGPAGMAGLRTVDEFLLDHDGKVVGGRGAISDPASGVHTCKVTRLMSSKAPS